MNKIVLMLVTELNWELMNISFNKKIKSIDLDYWVYNFNKTLCLIIKKEKKIINFNNFVQLNNVIYKLMHIIKKKNENILFVFIVKVSFNTDKATLNDNENVQIKKLVKNNNIVKSMKNNNIILLTKNDDIMKSINYNDFMNTTFEFLTHMTTDQFNLTESVNSFEFFTFALINSFNFSFSMKNEFELNDD